MASRGPFDGRTIAVVNDLSVDEQAYLYDRTRALKEAVATGGDLRSYRISDSELAVYLMFLEDSTRTKESFRNAAKFHLAKVNDFQVQSSSIVTKKESITDTAKMLFGYSESSIFVIRSKLEGVCRWLEDAIGRYAENSGRSRPVFINAGDGRHEHPTQEFLDEFSFLEHKGWDRGGIHLALVGDLYHGRTVHSKVDGLKVFREVRVDLVAPDELALPEHYEQKMEEYGFELRRFATIDEYIAAGSTADIWYFTRLQLERMGEAVLDKADYLRGAVTFRREHLPAMTPDTRFYHPLPRHREHPTVPTFLDDTQLNAWDPQSVNGYYTRIIELALVAGNLGEDFDGSPKSTPDYRDDFVEEAPVRPDAKPEYKVGIKPVDNGIVIDHIGRGRDVASIWNQIDNVRRIMQLNCRSSHGVYHSSSPDHFKGLISLPDILSFDERQIKMLGAIAPGCTLNIIKDSRTLRKYRLHMPPRVYNFDEISCKNEGCVSHRSHHQQVRPEFFRAADSVFECKYCERPHNFEDIWDL